MITHPNHAISLLWKEFLYISLFLAERFICGLNLGLGRSFLRFGVRISLSGRFLALLSEIFVFVYIRVADPDPTETPGSGSSTLVYIRNGQIYRLPDRIRQSPAALVSLFLKGRIQIRIRPDPKLFSI